MPSLKLNNNGRRGKKNGSFNDVAREAIEREGRDPDIDHGKSHLNVIRGFQSTNELLEYSRNHVSEIERSTGKKVRKDAVYICATIIKPPVAELKHMSYEEQLRLLNTAVDEFSEIVRAENVKTVAIHFDEMGPHAHIFWEPYTTDGRLCAKEMHDRSFFHKVNDRIPKALRAAGYDVDDCEIYDLAEKEYAEEKKKSGRTSATFKRDMEKEKAILADQLQGIQKELAEKEKQVLSFQQVKEIKPKKKMFKKDVIELPEEEYQSLRLSAMMAEDALEKVRQIKQEYASKESALEVRETELDKMNQDLQKEKDSLEKRKEEFQQFQEDSKKQIEDMNILAERQKDNIIIQARAEAKQIVNQASSEATGIKEDISHLQVQKIHLERSLKPLESRAERAGDIVTEAEKSADSIKKAAYQEGYTAGRKNAFSEYNVLIQQAEKNLESADNEAKEIIKSAQVTADQERVRCVAEIQAYREETISRVHSEAEKIKEAAGVEAAGIVADAKVEAEQNKEAISFWNELMTAEGNPLNIMFRKEPWFWLSMEKTVEKMSPLENRVRELEGVLSYIPDFIVDRAKAMFHKLGRKCLEGESYIDIEPLGAKTNISKHR